MSAVGLAHLCSALDRTQVRLQAARRELASAEHNADSGDPRAARTLRRLEDDLAAAEKDAAWLQNQLDPGTRCARDEPLMDSIGSASSAKD
jgi:hypothetical protein